MQDTPRLEPAHNHTEALREGESTFRRTSDQEKHNFYTQVTTQKIAEFRIQDNSYGMNPMKCRGLHDGITSTYALRKTTLPSGKISEITPAG